MDFSGISTENLRDHIKYGKDNCIYCGLGIACTRCPFREMSCVRNSEKCILLVEQELERRERMEMPELKAGMIVEFEHGLGDKLLYINDDWMMSFCNDGWADFDNNLNKGHISKIYKSINYRKGYTTALDKLELVWSKKSPNQEKIKEIESTIEELKKQVKELKDEN